MITDQQPPVHQYTRDVIVDRIAELAHLLKDQATVIDGMGGGARAEVATLMDSALATMGAK